MRRYAGTQSSEAGLVVFVPHAVRLVVQCVDPMLMNLPETVETCSIREGRQRCYRNALAVPCGGTQQGSNHLRQVDMILPCEGGKGLANQLDAVISGSARNNAVQPRMKNGHRSLTQCWKQMCVKMLTVTSEFPAFLHSGDDRAQRLRVLIVFPEQPKRIHRHISEAPPFHLTFAAAVCKDIAKTFCGQVAALMLANKSFRDGPVQ